MTPEKAIKILERHHKAAVCQLHKEIGDATQLGIVALKEIQYLHEIGILHEDELLPGETEE